MKIIVTESQLRNLAKKHRKKKDFDEAASLSSPSTSNQTSSSSSSSTGGSSTGAPITDPSGGSEENGKSMGAAEYPAYPEVGHWESGLTRGPANQIATDSNWSDVVGSTLTRGHANSLK